MLFNLFLIILFAGSIGILWHRISEKIPELVAIPDEVIVARLHEDSARVKIFLLHAKTFWREPRYRLIFWRSCEKICYRIHIIFLKMDNGLMALAKKVRSHGDIAGAEENALPVSTGEEKQETAYELFVAAAEPPQAGLAPMGGLPRAILRHSKTHLDAVAPLSDRSARVIHSRVQEVRKRRSKTPLQGS